MAPAGEIAAGAELAGEVVERAVGRFREVEPFEVGGGVERGDALIQKESVRRGCECDREAEGDGCRERFV